MRCCNVILGFAISCIVAASAFAGVVQTFDGATYRGEVRLAPPAQVVVTPAQGRPVALELANVAYASVADTPVPATVAALTFENWQHQDIGVCDMPGDLYLAPHLMAIDAGGVDIGYKQASATDNFHFAYQQLCGDGEIVAQVLSFTQYHREARVGVMFRETLDAGSANVMAYLTATISGMQYRLAQGDPTARIELPDKISLPCYLKVVRRGNMFRAYRSAGGRDWVLLGEQEAPLSRTLYVGLAATSRKEGRICTARFNHVKIKAEMALADDAGPAATMLSAGVVMTSGSAVPAQVVRGDRAELRLARKDGGEMVVPTTAISRLLLRPLSQPAAAGLDPKRPGLLLANGDFIDGEFDEMAGGQVRLTSLLFGPKSFDVSTAWAIVLRPPQAAPARYRLRLADGTSLAAKALRVEGSTLVVDDVSGAQVKVGAKLLSELRAGSR